MAIKLLLTILLIISTNELKLTSSDIKQNQQIADMFTPYGIDLNPSFEWTEVPPEVKSFVFSVEDPDAPRGLFYHWVVINIPATTTSIEQGKIPVGGVEIKNSWGKKKYIGPKPPSSTHHYHFVLYALNVDKIAATSFNNFKAEVNKYLVAKAEIVGIFTSKNDL